jgi:hypothetical protein
MNRGFNRYSYERSIALEGREELVLNLDGLGEQGFYFQLVEVLFGSKTSGSNRALAQESNLYCLATTSLWR